MHQSWIAAPILALALISSNLSAQTCETTGADKTAVVGALRTLYAGTTVDDLAMMHSVTAPTFYAFDGGKQFSSIDALMKVVKASQDQGVNGSVQLPNSAAPTPAQWLESAVLEKQDGSWKIVFFPNHPRSTAGAI